MKELKMTYLDDHGILSNNYYWRVAKLLKIKDSELRSLGLENDRVRVSPKMIPSLKKVNKVLKKHNYQLYVKEGYRSKELYKKINEEMKKELGQDGTKRVLNMKDMPHSTGLSVDTVLWDIQKNKEVPMRNKAHGINGLFVNYYKNKKDSESKKYQKRQEFLIEVMLENGFELGTKKEYFHFNYVGS